MMIIKAIKIMIIIIVIIILIITADNVKSNFRL